MVEQRVRQFEAYYGRRLKVDLAEIVDDKHGSRTNLQARPSRAMLRPKPPCRYCRGSPSPAPHATTRRALWDHRCPPRG